MISTKDLAWTAGFLEGEGSFTFNQRSVAVTAAQVQKQPLEKLRELFGGSLSLARRAPRPGKGNEQPIWTWSLSSLKALEVMMTLYVMMSPKRQGQIEKCLRLWRARPKSRKRARHSPLCSQGHWLADAGVDKHGRCRICADACWARHYKKNRANPQWLVRHNAKTREWWMKNSDRINAERRKRYNEEGIAS